MFLASPVPWKERNWECGKWPTERAGEEEGHLSTGQSVPAGRGSGWDNLPFPVIPLDGQGKPAIKRDPRGGAPRGGRGFEVVCGGQRWVEAADSGSTEGSTRLTVPNRDSRWGSQLPLGLACTVALRVPRLRAQGG